MKINGSLQPKCVEVADIKPGKCFTFNKEIFMVMEFSNAGFFGNLVKPTKIPTVRLETGHPAVFDRTSPVLPIEAEVEIK